MDPNRHAIHWARVASAAALLLLLTACAGGAPEQAAARPESGTDLQAAEPEAKLAPDFAVQSMDGEEFRLSDSAGQIRLIDFWATWCAPCREEIPMLNELQASYGDQGFRILAISDEAQDVVRDFLAEHDVQYTNLIGTEELSEAYGVLGLPAAYLVDREGRVVKSFLGPKPRRILVEKIEALLRAAPST